MKPEASSVNRLLLAIYGLAFTSVIIVVAMTSYLSGQAGLLRRLTVESGAYEIGSVVIMVLLAAYVIYLLIYGEVQERFAKSHLILVLIVGVLALVVAGEELSWGQHLLGFSSPQLFIDHNLQQETNLHNFIKGRYLSGFLKTMVYLFFIYGPCLYRLWPEVLNNYSRVEAFLKPLLPSFHVTLMMSFSTSLHPYFLKTSTSDTLSHIGGLLLILVLIWHLPSLRRMDYWVHWLAVALATGFFMLNTHVFSYYNMQAEIREFMFMLAGFIWFFEWTRRFRREKTLG